MHYSHNRTHDRGKTRDTNLPFEGWADIHHWSQPGLLGGSNYLVAAWKTNEKLQKYLFPLILSIFIKQNIFFKNVLFWKYWNWFGQGWYLHFGALILNSISLCSKRAIKMKYDIPSFLTFTSWNTNVFGITIPLLYI